MPELAFESVDYDHLASEVRNVDADSVSESIDSDVTFGTIQGVCGVTSDNQTNILKVLFCLGVFDGEGNGVYTTKYAGVFDVLADLGAFGDVTKNSISYGQGLSFFHNAANPEKDTANTMMRKVDIGNGRYGYQLKSVGEFKQEV